MRIRELIVFCFVFIIWTPQLTRIPFVEGMVLKFITEKPVGFPIFIGFSVIFDYTNDACGICKNKKKNIFSKELVIVLQGFHD